MSTYGPVMLDICHWSVSYLNSLGTYMFTKISLFWCVLLVLVLDICFSQVFNMRFLFQFSITLVSIFSVIRAILVWKAIPVTTCFPLSLQKERAINMFTFLQGISIHNSSMNFKQLKHRNFSLWLGKKMHYRIELTAIIRSVIYAQCGAVTISQPWCLAD